MSVVAVADVAQHLPGVLAHQRRGARRSGPVCPTAGSSWPNCRRRPRRRARSRPRARARRCPRRGATSGRRRCRPAPRWGRRPRRGRRPLATPAGSGTPASSCSSSDAGAGGDGPAPSRSARRRPAAPRPRARARPPPLVVGHRRHADPAVTGRAVQPVEGVGAVADPGRDGAGPSRRPSGPVHMSEENTMPPSCSDVHSSCPSPVRARWTRAKSTPTTDSMALAVSHMPKRR